MIRNTIELNDGFKATFDAEQNVYKLKVPWLGREIEIWLSAGDYEDEEELDCLTRAFERFWTEKKELLRMAQDDIRDELIPYISEHESTIKFLPYPEVTRDDFDAEYWLMSVYIIAMSDSDNDVKFNFNKEDENPGKELSVTRGMESGYISFDAGLNPVIIKKNGGQGK